MSKKLVNKTCPTCGKFFVVRATNKLKTYCSTSCRVLAYQKRKGIEIVPIVKNNALESVKMANNIQKSTARNVLDITVANFLTKGIDYLLRKPENDPVRIKDLKELFYQIEANQKLLLEEIKKLQTPTHF